MLFDDGQIFCVGMNHKTMSLSLREKFHLSSNKIARILNPIKQQFGYRELVILSTCNRCELYGVADDTGDFTEAFIAVHDQLLSNYRTEAIKDRLYTLTQQQAVRHILMVASSMDSLIVGETQIVSQFKKAFALAQQAGTCGSLMQQLLQIALATAKKIRNQTEIGQRTVSISHAAIVLSQKLFANLKTASLLVVGAGEMAAIATKYAVDRGVERLTIINRDLSRAQRLSADLNRGDCRPLTELAQALATNDIVITATTADSYLIDSAMLEEVQRQRNNRQLALIDISLPRNIDPACQDLENIYLFDLDDMKAVIDQNTIAREQASQQAISLIDKGTTNVEKTFIEREIGSAVANFKNFLQQLIKNQTERTLAKSLFDSLTVQQKEALHNLSEIIVNKVVGQVSVQLKDSTADENQLIAFRKLFS